jgi:hypothetical protein
MSELGPELHAWVKRNVPEGSMWRGYLEALHELYGDLTDLEQVLTELDECPPGSLADTVSKGTRGSMRAAVGYCIPDFFRALRQSPAPLYDRLARERVRPGDVIITFNYDLACERALRAAGKWEISDGYGFELGVDAIPRSEVKLLKLHGSTNWCGLLFGGVTEGFFQLSGNVLPPRPVMPFRNDFEFLNYSCDLSDPLCAGIGRSGGFPALIAPASRKLFHVDTPFGREWEGFWDHLWDQARIALRSSDEIVVVGYSLPSADERARKLLLEGPKKESIIALWCGRRSPALRDEFVSRGYSRVRASESGRFEEYLATGSCS